MTRVRLNALSDSPLVEHAVRELRTFLPQVWTAEVSEGEAEEGDVLIVLGVVADLRTHGHTGSLLDSAALETEDAFTIETQQGAAPTAVIAGQNARGVLYGAYELLEHLGVRFYLSGPSLPKAADAELPVLLVEKAPVVPLRGVMPYTDFLTGPSVWNADDYAKEIENATRLRLNLFSMHFYTYEPFGQFSFKGEPRTEAFWDTSRTTRWRKRPGRISDFGIGREHFGEYEASDTFGARSAIDASTPAERFSLAEADIRGAFALAKERGMKTTVGFEVTDPPVELRRLIDPQYRFGRNGFGVCVSSPDARELLKAWIEGVLAAVPDVDVISLWQTETGPSRWGAGCPCEQCVAFRQEHPLRDYTISDLLGAVSGDNYYVNDIRESAQTFLQWVLLGYDIVREIAPDKEIALAGWYIEHLFADSHDFLPDDLILSSMTEVDPWEAQPMMEHYRDIPQRTWMINWWEIDFRMWLPQPKTSAYPPLLEKMAEYDVEAVIWQHWRTRTVDDNARYSALAMWDRDLTPEAYYRDAFGMEWGEPAAQTAADALLKFEAFERWLCHDLGWEIFAQDWFPPTINLALEYIGVHGTTPEHVLNDVRKNLADVPAIRERLLEVLDLLVRARRQSTPLRDGDRPGFWQNRVEYYLLYIDALESVGRAALTYADATSVRHPADEKPEQLAQTYWLLRDAPVAAFIQKLSDRVEDKGDLGTLVNLNNELWSRYRQAIDAVTQWFDEVGVGALWTLRIREDGTIGSPVASPDALSPAGQWATDS